MRNFFVLAFFLLTPLPNANAAKDSNDKQMIPNICSLMLNAEGMQKLDPILYIHLAKIQELLDRLPETNARFTIVDSSGVGKRINMAIDARAPEIIRLPVIVPRSDFNLSLSSKPNGKRISVDIKGTLKTGLPSQKSKKYHELVLTLRDADLSKAMPDVQALAIILSLSLASTADVLTVQFPISLKEMVQLKKQITEFKEQNADANDLMRIFESGPIEQLVTLLNFQLSSISLIDRNEDFPDQLSVSYFTNRIHALFNHLKARTN